MIYTGARQRAARTSSQREIEMLLVAATRSWADDLEERADRRATARSAATTCAAATATPSRPPTAPTGSRARAVADVEHIEALARDDDLALSPVPPARGAARRAAGQDVPLGRRRSRCRTCCRCSRTWACRSPTSGPTRSRPTTREPVWIYDFGLTYAGDDELEADQVQARRSRTRSSAPGAATSRTTATTACCCARGSPGARSPCCARSARYLRQAGTTFSDRYVEQRARRPPATSRGCWSTCSARASTPTARDAAAAERLVDEIEEAIDAVESLDQDRILRTFLAVVQAMLRTNYFQRGRRRRAEALPLVQARPVAPVLAAAAAARASRSSSTRRAPRACTCAAARSRAAASAGRTGARTSAPRCSA